MCAELCTYGGTVALTCTLAHRIEKLSFKDVTACLHAAQGQARRMTADGEWENVRKKDDLFPRGSGGKNKTRLVCTPRCA